MLLSLKKILEDIPYWLVELIPLFVFSLAALFIFKVRSKVAVLLLITLSAVIVFYLSYFISTNCWAEVQCSVASSGDACLVNSYCLAKEERELATFMAFIKAFVLWCVALTVYFFKLKFARSKVSLPQADSDHSFME